MRLDTDLVHVTEIDDQAVVLDSATSDYLTANGAGAVILEALRGETTIDDLVEAVVNEFEVSDDTARVDCLEFVDELERRGWLIGAGGAEIGSTPR